MNEYALGIILEVVYGAMISANLILIILIILELLSKEEASKDE